MLVKGKAKSKEYESNLHENIFFHKFGVHKNLRQLITSKENGKRLLHVTPSKKSLFSKKGRIYIMD